MKTDTKVIVAGAVLVALGAWYLQRQVSNAAGAAWSGLANGLGGVYDSIASGLGSAVDGVQAGASAAAEAMGVQGYTDPSTGAYTPYGAVPDSFRAEPGTYLGGWGSTAVTQATQADVRRIDNAIDATGTGRRWWEVMATQSY